MTDSGDLKAAEARGYAKGYAAGKRHRSRNGEAAAAFWQKTFLTAFKAVLNGEAWQMDGHRIVTMDERIELARRCADKAVAVSGVSLKAIDA